VKIARVFPRKTKATPDDSLAFANCSPPTSLPEIDEVHISVTFTYDMRRAEELEREWRVIGVPVKMGGAADGISDRLDEYWIVEPDIPRVTTETKNRANRLKCLGNAVVPQQVYPIFKAIAEIEYNAELYSLDEAEAVIKAEGRESVK